MTSAEIEAAAAEALRIGSEARKALLVYGKQLAEDEAILDHERSERITKAREASDGKLPEWAAKAQADSEASKDEVARVAKLRAVVDGAKHSIEWAKAVLSFTQTVTNARR